MDCLFVLLLKPGYRTYSLAFMSVCTACLFGFALASPPALADPTPTRQTLQVGYTTKFVFLPPSRLLQNLRDGIIDFAPGLSGTPLVVYETLESWVSPVNLELHAWHLNTTETLKTFDQIKHKRVIVISGYNYGGLMSWMEKQSAIALTEAPNRRASIDMLERNRGDYLVDYHKPVQALLSAPGDENLHSTKLSSRKGVWGQAIKLLAFRIYKRYGALTSCISPYQALACSPVLSESDMMAMPIMAGGSSPKALR
jgi:polar amino acid transport system substrate-binding protein